MKCDYVLTASNKGIDGFSSPLLHKIVGTFSYPCPSVWIYSESCPVLMVGTLGGKNSQELKDKMENQLHIF